MFDTARSFLSSHRDASELVRRAQRFSVRLPLIGQVTVPPPDQLAFYGVLGVLAGVGAIEWPVAVAIGVGQAVVARHVNGEPQAATRPTADDAPQARTAPAKKAPAKKAPAKKPLAKKAPAKKAAAKKSAQR
ncbi:hypothetical protein BST34_05150 [Mycolicibacterium monacense DSM 44395]|uniref:Uncharacterized protein n=1 Tax=Mycolicibacterium monacense TaxID=85693 RepID=A0AAD1J120_MYCMB|nr:hypothetical protein [Mycolicibacterium monacense DSM 44395]ORB23346.1 hypothetical protein BST34_05150 [Mycolicibacterium monacense DSM 44395]QHP85094.1 hypothetical protein EWR22_06735 [Mycolicibacterium monacense DSM 44395]BBZ62071.1 hypothetical protein MMON_33720 [Mycolicibacterium monacense]